MSVFGLSIRQGRKKCGKCVYKVSQQYWDTFYAANGMLESCTKDVMKFVSLLMGTACIRNLFSWETGVFEVLNLRAKK